MLSVGFASAMLDYNCMKRVVSNTSTGAKGFGPADYIKISIFGFALAALWSSLHTIVVKHSKGKASRQHFKLDEVGLISPPGIR